MIINTIRMSDFHEDPEAAGGFVQVPRGSYHQINNNNNNNNHNNDNNDNNNNDNN